MNTCSDRQSYSEQRTDTQDPILPISIQRSTASLRSYSYSTALIDVGAGGQTHTCPRRVRCPAVLPTSAITPRPRWSDATRRPQTSWLPASWKLAIVPLRTASPDPSEGAVDSEAINEQQLPLPAISLADTLIQELRSLLFDFCTRQSIIKQYMYYSLSLRSSHDLTKVQYCSRNLQ